MQTPKARLRREKISLRKKLSAEKQKIFSHQISEKLLSSDWYKTAHNILLYSAMPGEADLSEFANIAKAQGKKLFYPRCTSKTEMIALHTPQDIWTTGSFGINEPDPDFSETLNPLELDLIICPCVSFDEACNRLGMGAGYYDRFLEKCTNAHVIAVAFECQKTPLIPIDEYDVKMEHIFTEKQIY